MSPCSPLSRLANSRSQNVFFTYISVIMLKLNQKKFYYIRAVFFIFQRWHHNLCIPSHKLSYLSWTQMQCSDWWCMLTVNLLSFLYQLIELNPTGVCTLNTALSCFIFVSECYCNRHLLAECYYIMFGLQHEPTVCHLSVCRVVHPTKRVELLGNIFAPSNSLGTRAVCIKIVGKIQSYSRWPCKLNGSMKNWCFWTGHNIRLSNLLISSYY